ncbi:MAG: BlaI/MecI/CopY family transcriptional regulator [Eubacteriales bacterium]|nr:BlaI/MecI/CopY family transcriptional regulator [Eubacteriales bacterium]
MENKLYDSELKIMEILWKQGDTTAKEIAAALYQQIGWSKTTTYTVIKKCITKGAIERKEPNFICRALISKEEAQEYETQELIEKLYDGRPDKLIASVISGKAMDKDKILRLKELINKL